MTAIVDTTNEYTLGLDIGIGSVGVVLVFCLSRGDLESVANFFAAVFEAVEQFEEGF